MVEFIPILWGERSWWSYDGDPSQDGGLNPLGIFSIGGHDLQEEEDEQTLSLSIKYFAIPSNELGEEYI